MSYLGNRWSRTRQLGRTRFVLGWGVGYWGVTTAIMVSVISSRTGAARFMETLEWALPSFMVGGLVWGVWMWSLNEGRHGEL